MTTIPLPSPPEVHFPDPPTSRRPIQDFGYTCQVYLVKEVYKQVFTVPPYRVWFSKAFNSVPNTDSSNPAQIYLSLSRAVQTHDVGSRIIRGYRTALLDTVEKNVSDPNIRQSLKSQISGASVESFRPQVWLLDLDTIANSRSSKLGDLLDKASKEAEANIDSAAGQVLQPDEYLITDLKHDEFIIIIDG